MQFRISRVYRSIWWHSDSTWKTRNVSRCHPPSGLMLNGIYGISLRHLIIAKCKRESRHSARRANRGRMCYCWRLQIGRPGETRLWWWDRCGDSSSRGRCRCSQVSALISITAGHLDNDWNEMGRILTRFFRLFSARSLPCLFRPRSAFVLFDYFFFLILLPILFWTGFFVWVETGCWVFWSILGEKSRRRSLVLTKTTKTFWIFEKKSISTFSRASD